MLKKDSRLKKFLSTKQIWAVVALLLILLFNLLFIEDFFSISINNGHLYGRTIDILNRGSSLVIVSLGMMLVIATAGIDISVGAVSALGAMSAAFILENFGDSTTSIVLTAIFVGVAVGALSGAWNGMLVSKFGIQPMIATLILMTAGRGLAQIISDGQIITISKESPYFFLGGGYLFGIPFSTFIMVFAVLLIYLLTRKTSIGLMIESIGINETSTRYSGVNTIRIKWICYVICAVTAAVSGMMDSSNVLSSDGNNNGLWLELDAILAVVLGGTSMAGGRFYITGTVIGALFIQTLTTTIYAFKVPAETILIVKAVVIIIVILFSSDRFSEIIKKLRTGERKAKEAA